MGAKDPLTELARTINAIVSTNGHFLIAQDVILVLTAMEEESVNLMILSASEISLMFPIVLAPVFQDGREILAISATLIYYALVMERAAAQDAVVCMAILVVIAALVMVLLSATITVVATTAPAPVMPIGLLILVMNSSFRIST